MKSTAVKVLFFDNSMRLNLRINQIKTFDDWAVTGSNFVEALIFSGFFFPIA